MNNLNISVRNNQAFLQDSFNKVIGTLFSWHDKSYSKINILNYIIRNVSCYGTNSHPSQTTIGRHAGVKRGWVNIVTNELVEMGLIKKTRIIINGDEMACQYALGDFFKDSKVRWMLKDILPALKLLYVFHKKNIEFKTDNTPYILYIYFKKNFKILGINFKSISRKKLAKISKLKKAKSEKERKNIMKDIQRESSWYELKQQAIEQHRQKEEEERLLQASQDKDFVSFLQGLLNGI